jgi:hypothetical protein
VRKRCVRYHTADPAVRQQLSWPQLCRYSLQVKYIEEANVICTGELLNEVYAYLIYVRLVSTGSPVNQGLGTTQFVKAIATVRAWLKGSQNPTVVEWVQIHRSL